MARVEVHLELRAAVLEDIESVKVVDAPKPTIQKQTDALVRITSAAICGSDLKPFHGIDLEESPYGTIMGHEGLGILEELGDSVRGFKVGDRVVVPFNPSCGDCFYCQHGQSANCLNGVGYGGKDLPGSQAEFIRAPYAHYSMEKVPDSMPDEKALFASDILSTAYMCAERGEIKKDLIVAVVGCGPVGLLAQMCAQLFEPSTVLALDTIEYRLQKAREIGSLPIDANKNALERILSLTDNKGVDRVLEAVGTPSALDMAFRIARAGAVVSSVGWHAYSTFSFPIDYFLRRGLTLKMGICSVKSYMSKVLDIVERGRVDPSRVISHILPLERAPEGYRIFDRKEDRCIKVVLKP